jgi:hypothetical protein
MLRLLSGFPVTPAGRSSEITGGLTGGRGAAPPAVPPALARAYDLVGRDGELKASADKAFVATLGFLAGGGPARAPAPGRLFAWTDA